MRKNHTFQLHLILTILVMVFIFWQSSLTAELSTQESNRIVLLLTDLLRADAEIVSFCVRKAAHFTEYLVLGACLWLTVRDAFAHRQGRMPVWLPWAIGAFYAVTDEIHQYFVPGRSCELRDMLIDACGVAAGVLLCRLAAKRGMR